MGDIVVNARLGFNFERVSVSGWVKNVFNNKTFTSISDVSVLANNFAYSTCFSGVVVGLPDLRTFGLDVKYKF